MNVAFGNSGQAVDITSSGGITIGSVITGNNGFTKTGAGSGILTLSGADTYSGNTTISAGTLALSGSGSIASSPTITIATGAKFDVSAVTPSGFTLNSSGTLALNINKTGSTLTQSQLAMGSKNLTHAGTLTVTASGDTLANGDSFNLITTSGTTSGWFSTVTLPALASGLAWDTNKLATTGVLDIYPFTTNTVEAMSTTKNTAANLLIAKLLSKAASSRGAVALSSVSAGSAQGGTVAISGSNISYSPASNFTGSDSFTAVLSDGHGSITATVVVTVTDPNSSSGNGSNLSIRSDGGSGVVIIIAGSPGTNYVLQYNTTLSTSGWNTFTNFTMPLTGITNYADSVSLGSRYYRTIQP